MPRGPGRPARRAASSTAWPLALVAVLGGVSACSGGPSYSRFTSDACAVTLPVAGAAVHGRGTLHTVRPFRRAEVLHFFGVQPPPLPSPSPSAAAPGQPRACLVVWTGPFAAGSVVGDGHSGRYALVLVRVRQPTVLRVRVVDTYPPA